MADVVVSALANKTVDIATNLIISEGSRLYWLSEDINWLERQLRHTQSYLEDAEAKKVTNPKVENLLKDIRDLAYDVEDVLDTFLPKIELHRAQCSIKRAATILSYSHTCSGFAREIEKIKRRVEGIDADRKTYGVEGTSGGSDKFNVDPRTTALHFDEPIVVGFDKDIEELKMKLLSHEEEEYRVVSIVGMAGLGKTTLAKKVFGFVRHRFDCSASISVSQDPNVKSLLQDIAKQVGVEEKKREENIEANLYSFLQTKRYVLFLDDIWHTQTWDSLKVSFPLARDSGSRIIITSRYNNVGNYISGRDSLLHQLQPFDFQTSWELFSKSIVPSLEITNQGLNLNSDLGEIGKEIVKKCAGVPLAIEVTVGMLRERRMSEMAWREVLKSMGQDAHDKCSEILALSYKDLPTPLKPCFLYLGLFPEDYEMKASRVIRMWMAENFIQGCSGKLEPEDVGDNYLNTLDARNLIQVISRKYDGRINKFRIHDLLHNLCVNVGKEINFLHTTTDNVEGSSGSIRIRRLAINIDSLVTSNFEAHKVRALFIFGNAKSISKKQVRKILDRFKLLRVLSLEVDNEYVVRVEMKNLSRLKYLQMDCGLPGLTPSIKNHKMLQTLEIGSFEVPTCIWKIKRLRHVGLRFALRTFKSHEICLPNLQTLDVDASFLKAIWLNKFNNLRKLMLWGVDKETIDVLSSGSEPISNKLETLFLQSSDSGAGKTVFDLSKYKQLMKLTIEFPMKQFPQSHDYFPPNLVKLTLDMTKLREDPMQVLKKLPKLKILILGSRSYVGTTLDYSGLGSFPRLQVLQLGYNLPNLEELVEGDQGISPPNLREVIINGCSQLERIPESLKPFLTRMWRKVAVHLLSLIFLTQSFEAKQDTNNPNSQRKWMTLYGGQPEIVARGGFSGFYPDSSFDAYNFANDISITGTILYCNLHFTKDNQGFCASKINLKNTTNIEEVDSKGGKTYNINGQETQGWFGFDYPSDVIFNKVLLRQNIYKRVGVFDGVHLMNPSQLALDKNNGEHKKSRQRVWLNVQYDIFYKQHNISAEKFLLERLNELSPEFISSPEIGFLKTIGPKVAKFKVKLIFVFLEEDILESSTKESYGSLVKKLSLIKSFAFGILVPKEYIWPVNKNRLLQPATSLVQDAHKQGIAVYASGFANDNYLSYNYSYDPTKEYLQFVDNSQFCVDGVLTDFPSTASEAIGCLIPNKKASRVIKTSIISHNGASGDFPGSSDLAYQKAIDDGADIIDCSVQMSKDGVALCSDRADLMKTTTAATLLIDRSTNVPEIQATDGVFSFDLTWSEINSLKPQLESSYDNELVRNPENMNKGRFMTLSEFLELAKVKAVTGVLISIQNAAYLASKKGLDIVDTVSTALRNATFDKQSTQKVLIQSDDTSVLSKFKDFPKYQRVLYIHRAISGAADQVAQEIKKYADAVFVHRDSIVVASNDFAYNFTKTVSAFHAAKISVYVGFFKNEFQNLIMDYFSDPYVELATYYSQNVDGFVTDYPGTANSFVRSSCTSNESAYIIHSVVPGALFMPKKVDVPPLLTTADVVDPPLPPVAKNSTDDSPFNSSSTSKNRESPKSSSTSTTLSYACLFVATMVEFLSILVLK